MRHTSPVKEIAVIENSKARNKDHLFKLTFEHFSKMVTEDNQFSDVQLIGVDPQRVAKFYAEYPQDRIGYNNEFLKYCRGIVQNNMFFISILGFMETGNMFFYPQCMEGIDYYHIEFLSERSPKGISFKVLDQKVIKNAHLEYPDRFRHFDLYGVLDEGVVPPKSTPVSNQIFI